MTNKKKGSKGLHICVGADGMKECHFNGACYGMICVAPRLCSRSFTELTADEQKYVKRQKEWS